VDVSGGFDDTLETPQGSLTVLDPAELTKGAPGAGRAGPRRHRPGGPDGGLRLGASGGPGTTGSGGGGGGFGIARFGNGGESIRASR
jgi:hypothetical protein